MKRILRDHNDTPLSGSGTPVSGAGFGMVPHTPGEHLKTMIPVMQGIDPGFAVQPDTSDRP